MPEEWVCGEKPSHVGIIVACTAVVEASFRIELTACAPFRTKRPTRDEPGRAGGMGGGRGDQRSVIEDRARTAHTPSVVAGCRLATHRSSFVRGWRHKTGRFDAGERPRTRSQRQPTPQAAAVRGVFQRRLRPQEGTKCQPRRAFVATCGPGLPSMCLCLTSTA